MSADLFDVYRLDRVEWWYVLLRNGYPVAVGSLDTVRRSPYYGCVINVTR